MHCRLCLSRKTRLSTSLSSGHSIYLTSLWSLMKLRSLLRKPLLQNKNRLLYEGGFSGLVALVGKRITARNRPCALVTRLGLRIQ